MKEEALDRAMWRNRFGGGFGPVVRQNTEWMNESNFMKIRPVRVELFHADRRRYMMKLVVAFCDFEKTPKNGGLIFNFARTSGIP